MGAGVFSIFFVAKFFTIAQQGLYYAILSVLAMQMIFELGLNQVLMQAASRFIVRGKLRIGYLIYASKRWFLLVSFVYILSAYFYGDKVFGLDLPTVPMGGFFWLLMIILSAWSLIISATLSIYEGSGAENYVYKFKLTQSVLGSCLFWLGLYQNLGVWAMIASNSVGVILYYLLKEKLFPLCFSIREINKIRMIALWRKKIYPLQWRISLTWLSGYFFSGYLVSLIYINSPTAAGQYGMSLAIFSAIQAFFIAAFNIKLPYMTALIVKKDIARRRYFLGFLAKLMVFYVLIVFGFCCLLFLLNLYKFQVIERLSDIYLLGCLALTGVINFFAYCINSYIRAKGEDKSWPISLCAVAILFSSIKVFKVETDIGLGLTVLLVSIIFIFPYNIYLIYHAE